MSSWVPMDDDADAPVDETNSVVVGPSGLDDPETEWHIEGVPEETPGVDALADNEVILLAPGEDPEIADEVPKRKRFPLGVAFGRDRLIVCSGRSRQTVWTQRAEGQEPGDVPPATDLTVVFIEHRADGNRMRPRRYLVVTSGEGELLGWLDYSDTWGFDGEALKICAEGCGLEFAIERYGTESEFDAAHRDWVG